MNVENIKEADIEDKIQLYKKVKSMIVESYF